MIWWWRARALTVVFLSLAGSIAVGIVIGEEVLPLPSLVSALVVPVVFAYLLPLVPVVALWHGVDRSVGALEAAAVRPIATWDLVVRGGMILIAAMATGATAVGGWWNLGPGYLRNLIGCLGVAQLAAPFVGSRLAGLAPVCAVIISVLFGAGPGGLARWWAWPIAEPCSGLAFAEAGLLLIVGIAVAAGGHPRPRNMGGPHWALFHLKRLRYGRKAHAVTMVSHQASSTNSSEAERTFPCSVDN